MKEQSRKGTERRQETEANAFAIGLLAPQHLLANALRDDPDLGVAVRLAGDLDLSLEAMLRRYVELNDEPLAAVWSKAGIIRWFVRGKRFPYLHVRKDARLHPRSRAADIVRSGRPGKSRMLQVDAFGWLRDPGIELFEQTRIGRTGYAVTLLWATVAEATDKDAEMDEPWVPRFTGSRR